MKKLLASILAVMLVIAMTSCSGGNSGASGGDQAAQQSTDDKSIVVYFSCTGNTKAVAEEIAAQTGSDLQEIVPEPYTEEDLNYNDDSCRANVEMNDPESRPAISNTIENLSDYDTIYIGYPIWWSSLPRIMNTFFDTYDFSGKTIVPFCTSGSSSISQSLSVIREAEPEAQVKEGLQVSSAGADDSSDEVSRWLEEIK